ncbi:MAG: HEAT repeat domain-containing protein [Kiritimatiellia bacterium]|nr:HEAT repeat domain-containing protein [Kiritimatiellia bacterium]MDP6847460.1 HEAT repeat domain-containing protein [Kiritimatiellia bacterium]
MRQRAYLILTVLLAASLLSPMALLHAAPSEAELIGVLKSDAPKAEKAITCKKLAVWGSKDAVPVLVPLLKDEQLASWARIALEQIPDPACKKGLRDAAPGLKGRMLIGVINSLGVLQDAEAVPMLITKTADADPEIACAAAAALGRIGGDKATDALVKLLKHSNMELRSTAAYACNVSAEKCLKAGNGAKAISLYGTVAKAEVPGQRIREATEGGVLARGEAGHAMIPNLLASKDMDMFQVALRLLRRVPGLKIDDKMLATLKALPRSRQETALVALANSGNSQALPVLIDLSKSISKEGQRAIVSSMAKIGNASCVPLLAKHAGGADPELAETAMISLVVMRCEGIEESIISELKSAPPAQCCALLKIVDYREIKEGLPLAAKYVNNQDKSVADAAVSALAKLGSVEHIPGLVGLVAKKGPDPALIKALRTISSRNGAKSLPALRPLLQNKESDIRREALHCLASAGGPDALAALVAAINDKDEGVSDQAVRALSTWPNVWPDDPSAGEPLLKLAKDGKKQLHKVLALRGYAEYVRTSKKMSPADKFTAAKEIMKLAAGTPEEGKAIALLATIRTEDSLKILMQHTSSERKEEAFAAIFQLVEVSADGIPKDLRRQAVQQIMEGSKNRRLKKRAAELLGRIK